MGGGVVDLEYQAGVGGQGLYVSFSRDIVVAWFCTGDENNQEETMARAIATNLVIGV